jgi:hypothetical protein
MIIPGFIISWLTFPGVIVHEWAHLVFCRLTDTPVHEVCYFRFGNPAGYVIHEQPDSVWHHILIGIGPLLVNSLIGLAMGLLLFGLGARVEQLPLVSGILFWLAISIAMHSFPSTGDAKSIWQAVWSEGAPISARLVGSPLVGLIFLGAIGSIFWLDVIYGCCIVIFLPKLLFP